MSYYFDSASTEEVSSVAWEAMKQAPFGNPSSLHSEGWRARESLERSRAQILSLLGAGNNYELYFTSGATEACNTAIHSMQKAVGISETYASPFEHHAILECVSGRVLPNDKVANTGAYAQMLANNETGEIYDIAALRGSFSGLLACDITSAVAHIPINLLDFNVDYAMFGGHKFGTPKGIGALIVRDGSPVTPMICGGGQERGMRGGTESVALACAMAAALEKRCETMYDDIARITKLRDEFITEILRLVPDAYINGPWVICDAARRLPNNANISFLGVESQSLVLALSRKGLCASSGSACTSGSLEGSYVLRAMGLSEERACSAVRFTLPYRITHGEVKRAVEIIVNTVFELRALSPSHP
jgi:cysteine desulfurase